MDNNDFLTELGPQPDGVPAAGGRPRDDAHPQGGGAAHQGRGAGRHAGLGRRRRRGDGRLRLRPGRQAPVRRGPASGSRSSSSNYLVGHRRPLGAARRAHPARHAARDHLQLEPLPRAAEPQGVPHPHPRAAHRHARHLRRPGPHPVLRLLRGRAPADVLHDRRVGRRGAPVRLDQVLPLHAVRLGADDRELRRRVLRRRRRELLDGRASPTAWPSGTWPAPSPSAPRC